MGKYERNMDLGQGAVLRASLLRTAVEADYMRVDEDKAVNDRTEYVGILKDEVVIIDSDHEEVWAGFFALRPHFTAMPDLKTSLGN
jgi:hypothetical protein